MGDAGGSNSMMKKIKGKVLDEEEEEDSDEEMVDSEDDDETIARIQRAHFAQAAAMNARRRSAPRPRPMSQKRKMEAVRNFHDFTKKLKKDTGITIRSLVGNNILELSDFSSGDSITDSDGLSEEEFEVNPSAVQELNEENESYIDPETGDIVDAKRVVPNAPKDKFEEPASFKPEAKLEPEEKHVEEPKTLSISDIINDGDLDAKNVEIDEVDESDLCSDKTAEELLGMKQEENSQDYDITEKLKEMGEISVKPLKREEDSGESSKDGEMKPEVEEDKKPVNPNALNVRRNIREVMDEKNLDASTIAAQRQESERLARVQEQQRIIREVQRQIAINRQNKIHQKTLSLLQGGSSLLKKSLPGHKLNLPNTVLVKLPSGEIKRTATKHGQVEVTKLPKPTTSGAQKLGKLDQQKREVTAQLIRSVVEIVDSSSGDESSSSTSDSDDCIMLSDSEVPPSPEADEDPGNSGLHVNDAYNVPDEQGRVLINFGHPEKDEDIFLAPQIARIIKPHQIGGVRFLFDNIIESVERFSTSTGFGCILAHSMGLGKTLQIVCFCDIFLRHTNSKTVLCIMPINTLQNWVAEFNIWLPLDSSTSPLSAHGEVRPRNFPIYVLNDSHKTLQMRAKVVKDWATTGGVLMIGYELYRLLSMKKDKKPRKKKKADVKLEADKEKDEKKSEPPADDAQNSEESKLDKEDGENQTKSDETKDDLKKEDKKEDTPPGEDKKLLDEMYEALVRPGPDLVICDEGHRIKNSHSNISYALKQMRTKRRIVLTGYPLQNNLLEYWCMVDFVRPNYLGSKTEFCNMFERPIQNGQCIDSTPQDIRLMRYRAHVLHSLLVGFVQRRSHAVLQSTLPQKEEYVLLVRMTPLQRKLYDRFMNEVVRSTSVPNPLKAFAICCKIWNHPDVLYNFLRKRSEVNAAIEEDLDLEEIGGVTKAGRARSTRAAPRRAPKPRGSSKKPAATIPPNTTTGPVGSRQDSSYGNAPYPANAPYGPPPNTFRPDQPTGSYHPPYPNYQNPGQGYYPPNQGYNQNYDNNYYQQQPPYPNNYPNQYPQNMPEGGQGYNQNYWGNGNYYGNSGYYNNPQYTNSQPPQDYRGNAPADFNDGQHYPPGYTAPPGDQSYPSNALQPYSNSQEGFANHQRPPYQGYPPQYSEYNANAQPGPYPNNSAPQNYPNQPPYPPPYAGNPSGYGPNSAPFNQFNTQSANFPNYQNNTNQTSDSSISNQSMIKNETNTTTNYPANDIKSEPTASQNTSGPPYGNPPFVFPPNTSSYPDQQEGNSNGSFPCQYPNFPPHLETKPPLGSGGSGSPVTSWPITELKTEVDKLKAEEKIETKSESDGEVKIEDLDTKKIVKDETKKPNKTEPLTPNDQKGVGAKKKDKESKGDAVKSDGSESEEERPKKAKPRGRPKENNKKVDKSKARGKTKAKGRNDRKTSKEKNNDDSESEESEKEEKISREEELANLKKAEEMTYDWATELLKDYIPGIIENSAKMELFFYILNESIKMGDRLLLFSQSLFTLNLIEDFLEKNYIPGTNCLWERNTNYYRLDGSTHALEREKLINEFNANPQIYLFLVSTRAGSLGINLVGANRVIVFDASWNPCHDTQAVCRVYRYGQRKPCFVYRFVMDCCLEKKIYDRQINKQGMADRVVDECNPDAVLSMKEITNLCFDNDEKECEPKDLSEYKDKYIDVLMQGVITLHGALLSKEPFQHESLLVDRKEKKLSSAEKRLAQRGYELEKKAASAPKPTTAYRTVRTADGSLVQRPVASVRPMQHGARWIPADVWRRQGMTAQEMTLPLDVVIPTNSAEKTNIVLKAGQRVMVLKSPKGIYMQLESGKIIAIKTSLKGLGQKGGDNKDSNPIGKKVIGSRPSSTSLPGSLKNNSAITITSKTGPRPGFHRVLTRPSMMGHNKLSRPMIPGQKISDIRNRLGEMRSYTSVRPKLIPQGRLLRPNLPGSVSITKITKEQKKPDTDNDTNSSKIDCSDEETQILDSDDEEGVKQISMKQRLVNKESYKQKVDSPKSIERDEQSSEGDRDSKDRERVVLTTEEKLPPEETLENKIIDNVSVELRAQGKPKSDVAETVRIPDGAERKINLLKNYRHQRSGSRPTPESSLSQLERTASVLNKEGMPDFRKNLDDITQSYSLNGEEKCSKSKKKKSPTKLESAPDGADKPPAPSPGMSHSVSSLLGQTASHHKARKPDPNPQNTPPIAPAENARLMNRGLSHDAPIGVLSSPVAHAVKSPVGAPLNMSHPGMMSGGTATPAAVDISKTPSAAPASLPNHLAPGPTYPAGNTPPEGHYGQYPAYGMGYGAYPSAAYYAGYAGGAYYPPYAGAGAAPPLAPAPAPAPPYAPAPPATTYPPDGYLPPNPQW